MDTTTARASRTRETKEKSDFDLLLDEFGEFAMEAAENKLTKKVVSDYKSRLRALARQIDNEHGAGWFEEFVCSYTGEENAEGYRLCVIFIDGRLQAAQGMDKDRWLNRRTAFRKLASYLESR